MGLFHSHDHDHHGHSHHSHGHHHHHDHSHANKKALGLSFIVTIVVMVAEFVYGYLANSLALVSDALHMLMHAVALALSFYAAHAAANYKNPSKTFGYARTEIIAAFVNAVLIAIMTIAIIYEAIDKIIFQEKIDVFTMLVVATLGLIVNIISAVLLMRADTNNLNIKSSIIHMLSDLLSSVAIIIGGVVVYYTNWYWLDPLLALLIAAVIAKWAWGLFRATLDILLEASPTPPSELKEHILTHCAEIKDLHDIHAFSISQDLHIFMAHAVIDESKMDEFMQIVAKVRTSLAEYGINHITLQPEWRNDCACSDEICSSCLSACEFSCERNNYFKETHMSHDHINGCCHDGAHSHSHQHNGSLHEGGCCHSHEHLDTSDHSHVHSHDHSHEHSHGDMVHTHEHSHVHEHTHAHTDAEHHDHGDSAHAHKDSDHSHVHHN